MMWRLIATAPKDESTEILTWRPLKDDEPQGEVNLARWVQFSDGTGFWEADGSFDIEPTHWMPLPPCPNVIND